MADPPGPPPHPGRPQLGLYASLTAAQTAVRTERRQAAIAALLRRKLTGGRDRLAGEIAVTVYDLDAIAARLTADADYDGLAALIAADLALARLAPPGTPAAADWTSDPPPEPPRGTPASRPRGTPPARKGATTARPDATAGRVARLRARHPDITQAEVHRRTGISIRTLSRYWADTAPDTAPAGGNGGPVPVDTAVTAGSPATPVTTEPN